MSRTPLYRSEVLEAKRNRWLGRLVLRQPMSHWAMTGGAVAIVALLTVFLFVGEYARKVRISGRLIEIAASLRAVDGPGIPQGAEQDAAQATAQATAQASPQNTPRLEAELLIPEHALASVDVGAEVFLRYSAYPHQRYGQYRGRVLRISRIPVDAQAGDSPRSSQASAQASTQTPDEPAGARASLYRAVVSLERQRVRDDRGVERDLRPGLGVMADIVVERRPLYRWLFEPLARS